MCWNKILGCGVCSGEQCVLVLDQRTGDKLEAVESVLTTRSGDNTRKTSSSDAVPSAVDLQARISPTHCTLTDDRSLNQSALISILFCPTEEEMINFSHSGDYKLFRVTSKCPKEAGEDDVRGDNSCNRLEMIGYPNSHVGTGTNCLLTFNDNPGHQIASMNQVGDFPSKSDSYGNPANTPDSCASFRHTYDIPTVPDVSSTLILNDPLVPTSTTAGLRWTVYEQEDCHDGSFPDKSSALETEETDHFRPAVPTRFSLRFSSEGYPPAYPSESLIDEDAHLGYTSTTHEIRWTQVEQDPTQTTDRYHGMTLPLSVRFNIAPPKCVETTCRCPQITSVNKLHSDSAVLSTPRPIPTATATQGRTLRMRSFLPEKSTEHVCSISPAPSPTDRLSTLGEHSVPLVTEEAPYFTQTLNDPNWYGENPNPINVPNNSLAVSSDVNYKQGSTSLIVQHSSIHLPTSFYIKSFGSSSLEKRRIRCSRCDASTVLRRFIQHKATQTQGKPSTGVSYPTNGLLHCVFICPPVGSEPPPVSFRWSTAQDAKESDIISSTSNMVCVSPSVDDVLMKLGDTCGSTEVKKFTVGASERLAPLRIRQPPIMHPAKFIPFERLRLPAQSVVSRIGKGTQKIEELVGLDVNELDELNTDRTSLVYSNETERSQKSRGVLYCTYVEVLIRRNLESVAPPSCLNSSESRMIYNLLDRNLQNAVATQFMTCLYKYRKSLDHSVLTRPSITEGGDSEVAAAGKTVMTDEFPDLGTLPKVTDLRGSHVSTKSNSNLGNHSKKTYGGAYVFTQGPRHIKPPKPWWDHIRQAAVSSEFKSVAAWKLDPVKLIVGGLINYDHHLQIVVSSNDGRLGATYLQAVALMTEMCRKSTRYAKRRRLYEHGNQKMNELLGDSVRMYFKSAELARLLACADEDMSPAMGLEELGLGVVALPKQTAFSGRRKWEHIMLYTKGETYASEKGRIRQMITGVKRLRVLALELMRSPFCAVKRDIQPVESVDFLVRMTNQSPLEILNYTKRYLTSSLVSELKDKITSFDGTLAHCIRTTAYCPTYLCPKASDPEAYQVYERLFEPILKDINAGVRLRCQPFPNYQLPNAYQSKSALPNVISYRVRFVRNVAGYGFPPVMTLNDYLAVEKICKDVLLSWTEEGRGSWYSLSDIQEQHPAMYTSLVKKNLLMPRRLPCRKISGVYRFWPEGRAIYVAPNCCRDCDLVVQINGEDHLKVISVDWTGKQPNVAFTRASKLMLWLDTRIRFSRSSKWGFLSPIPWNVGTGMQISALVKCPYFGKDPELIDRICTKVQLQVRSDCSHGVPVLHNVFDIALQSTFGRTEADLTVSFLRALTRICRGYVKHVP